MCVLRAAWLAAWALARLTSHMICVSDHERQLAHRLPIATNRLSVIPNAVADSPNRAHPDHEPVRIVMVARLARPKRPDLLLQALALLRDRLGLRRVHHAHVHVLRRQCDGYRTHLRGHRRTRS